MYEIPDGEQISRDWCLTVDAGDPLAGWREKFDMPSGVIYLDGMSLGALPTAVSARVREVVDNQWGQELIRSWNNAGWIDAPGRLGAKIAPLLGVDSDEVVVADSTSVNLFKVLVAALRLRPGRRVILTESSNFPTDIYIARGAERLGLDAELRIVPPSQIDSAIDHDVAVAMLTHVDFKSSAVRDMSTVTRRAHECGALMLWDLSHSTGAMPLDLNGCDVDFGVGCGYKYLNGGPGAPAYAFVARRHHSDLDQPITAWMGHAKPFDFTLDFTPAPGMSRFLSGTPPIIALAALEAGLDVMSGIDMRLVRAKSIAMSELFIRIVEGRTREGPLRLASPRDSDRRGSHVAFQHPQGYAVTQALIDRQVIGDFREPDLMRFGFAPLYLSFVDIWQAANTLAEVVETGAWDQPRYHRRALVT